MILYIFLKRPDPPQTSEALRTDDPEDLYYVHTPPQPVRLKSGCDDLQEPSDRIAKCPAAAATATMRHPPKMHTAKQVARTRTRARARASTSEEDAEEVARCAIGSLPCRRVHRLPSEATAYW